MSLNHDLIVYSPVNQQTNSLSCSSQGKHQEPLCTKTGGFTDNSVTMVTQYLFFPACSDLSRLSCRSWRCRPVLMGWPSRLPRSAPLIWGPGPSNRSPRWTTVTKTCTPTTCITNTTQTALRSRPAPWSQTRATPTTQRATTAARTTKPAPNSTTSSWRTLYHR